MKHRFIIIAALTVMASCAGSDKKTAEVQTTTIESKFGKQLKISVLWDLSDRISPTKHKELPSPAEKDIAIIRYLADYFKNDMKKKGAYLAKGKLKIFFSPNPSDANINSLASKLDIDLSNKDVNEKKVIYDNIVDDFENTAKDIAAITIKTSKWEGSDIYRFFKNNVVDYCVEKDTTYRNILIILTDGYIYHRQTTGKVANKSEYINAHLLTSLGLRNNPNFKTAFQSKKCGLIVPRNDLNNLEILVLEINSEENFKRDEDIIKHYLETWFHEMHTKLYKTHSTDLPESTKKNIANFLNYK